MPKRNNNGFSLLELIIVLVIVGFMTIFVIPKLFNSLTHVELKTAARHTIARLHQARDIAYFKKKRIKVLFDLETDQMNTFEYSYNKDDVQEDLEEKEKKWSLIKEYSYPESVKIKSCQNIDEEIVQDFFEVFFSPSGSSSGGSITLGNKKKITYTIELDLITGNAWIKDNNKGE